LIAEEEAPGDEEREHPRLRKGLAQALLPLIG